MYADVDVHFKQIQTSANPKANPEDQEDAGQEAYAKVKQMLLENNAHKIMSLQAKDLKSTTASHMTEETDYDFFIRRREKGEGKKICIY